MNGTEIINAWLTETIRGADAWAALASMIDAELERREVVRKRDARAAFQEGENSANAHLGRG